MDWNTNLRAFVPGPESSFNFLYNNNNYDHFAGMKGNLVHHQGMGGMSHGGLVPGLDKNNINYGNQEKKKRLTSEQLESLESCFQDDIKLDPDRKMKLSHDLGLQPRQIAVWFQNRRARWKAKQLERLYDTLKQEFDVISREKQKLQQEVMKLKAIVREQAQATRKQVSAKDISGEETVESTTVVAIHSSSKERSSTSNQQNHVEAYSYIFNATADEDYNPVTPWSTSVQLPSYP